MVPLAGLPLLSGCFSHSRSCDVPCGPPPPPPLLLPRRTEAHSKHVNVMHITLCVWRHSDAIMHKLFTPHSWTTGESAVCWMAGAPAVQHAAPLPVSHGMTLVDLPAVGYLGASSRGVQHSGLLPHWSPRFSFLWHPCWVPLPHEVMLF